MLMHIVRMKPAWLRIPLLCLVFPVELAGYVLKATMPERYGGHPDKRRLLRADFYNLPMSFFWAAWDGHFVP